MSYKQNIVVSNGPVQLVDKSRFGNSVSQGGVTCTNNGDGSWTINGNVTAENRFNLNFYQLGANVIPYWLSPGVPVEHNYYTQDCYYDKLGGWLYYYLEEGKNYENFKIYPQIISLADTFGSGNEPKNKEQVKAKLPDDLYPYNPTNRVTTYKELIKVSDICQLLDKSKYYETRTVNGVTFTNNGDGTITVNSLNITANTYYSISSATNLVKGHKYCVPTPDYSGGYFYIALYKNSVYFDEISNKIYEVVDDNLQASPSISAYLNSPTGDKVYKPQFYDLTEIYGAGNEPTTVAEFKAKFPDELYPYSPNCWLTSYKNVSKVGEVCQLLDKSKYEQTKIVNGITFTNNGDGTITANGTAEGEAAEFFLLRNTRVGNKTHKFLLSSGAELSGYRFIAMNDGQLNVCFVALSGSDCIFTPTSDIYFIRIIIAVDGAQTNNVVFKPQLYDLTEMYGEGKEPKTVEEFRAKFPNEMYDYNLCCTV